MKVTCANRIQPEIGEEVEYHGRRYVVGEYKGGNPIRNVCWRCPFLRSSSCWLWACIPPFRDDGKCVIFTETQE